MSYHYTHPYPHSHPYNSKCSKLYTVCTVVEVFVLYKYISISNPSRVSVLPFSAKKWNIFDNSTVMLTDCIGSSKMALKYIQEAGKENFANHGAFVVNGKQIHSDCLLCVCIVCSFSSSSFCHSNENPFS